MKERTNDGDSNQQKRLIQWPDFEITDPSVNSSNHSTTVHLPRFLPLSFAVQGEKFNSFSLEENFYYR